MALPATPRMAFSLLHILLNKTGGMSARAADPPHS